MEYLYAAQEDSENWYRDINDIPNDDLFYEPDDPTIETFRGLAPLPTIWRATKVRVKPEKFIDSRDIVERMQLMPENQEFAAPEYVFDDVLSSDNLLSELESVIAKWMTKHNMINWSHADDPVEICVSCDDDGVFTFEGILD